MMQMVRSVQAMRGAVSRTLPSTCSAPPLHVHAARQHSHAATTRNLSTNAAQAGGADYETALRSFSQYAVYKGKAALSVKPIPPTWEAVQSKRGNMLQNVKRQGALFMEFAPVASNQGNQDSFGNRSYDWANKLTISLNVTELAQLSVLAPSSTMELYHDPDKNTPQENTRGKKLRISPMGQEGGYFFQLNGRTQGGQQSITVPVTLAEFTVLRRCADFLIPRLMGFDEMLMASGGSSAVDENGQ